MADSSVGKVKIPSLKDSSDYPTWCVFVQELLRREDLLGFIDQEPPDHDTVSAAAVNRWKKNDRTARSHIVLHLGNEAVTNVTSILTPDTTAKQVLERLKDIYQKDNLQAKLNLESKLYGLKFKDGDDIVSHLQQFEKTFNELSALGSLIEEREKVGHLLRSLPGSMSSIATVAGAINMGYKDVCSNIKSEIERRNAQEKPGQSSSTFPQPVARKTIDKSGGSSKPRRDIQCYYCKKFGHIKKDCRKFLRNISKSRVSRGRGRGRGRGGSSNQYSNRSNREPNWASPTTQQQHYQQQGPFPQGSSEESHGRKYNEDPPYNPYSRDAEVETETTTMNTTGPLLWCG